MHDSEFPDFRRVQALQENRPEHRVGSTAPESGIQRTREVVRKEEKIGLSPVKNGVIADSANVTKRLLEADLATTIEGMRQILGPPHRERQG